MSHSDNPEENTNEEKIKKLNKMIESREKQLGDMANMLADLNQQLNDTQVKNKHLSEEIDCIKETLDKKETHLKQELIEKELMFSKLQTLERENDKLSVLTKKDEKKPGFLESLKKGIHNLVANHQNLTQPQKIITSKQAIQTEKEKEKTIKKNEDFELGNLQNFAYNKKKEDPETHEDILERIRHNFSLEEAANSEIPDISLPKDKNRESGDSLTDQINKNSENVFK